MIVVDEYDDDDGEDYAESMMIMTMENPCDDNDGDWFPITSPICSFVIMEMRFQWTG